MSLIMEAPEDNLIFRQIIAPVTEEEISFMQEFRIENGDGVVDNMEFIVLAVVRIGAASPELIRRINDRFQELDRKHMGKILYDDLIVGRRRKQSPSTTTTPADSSSTAKSLHVVTLSNKARNLMRSRSNNIFRDRAKSVHEVNGSSAATAIEANIAKIESFRVAFSSPKYRSHSPVSSGSISTRSMRQVYLTGESNSDDDMDYASDYSDDDGDDDDDDADDDADSSTRHWRNPQRRRGSAASSASGSVRTRRDVEEGGGESIHRSSKSDRMSSKRGRVSSKSNRRSSSKDSVSNFNPSTGSSVSSGGGRDTNEDFTSSIHSDGLSISSRPGYEASRQNSFRSVEEGDEENECVEDAVSLSASKEVMKSSLTPQRLTLPSLLTRSQSSSSQKVSPESGGPRLVASRQNSFTSVKEGDEEKEDEDEEVDDKSFHSIDESFTSADDTDMTSAIGSQSQSSRSPLSARKVCPTMLFFPDDDEEEKEKEEKDLEAAMGGLSSSDPSSDDSDADCSDDEVQCGANEQTMSSGISKFKSIVKEQRRVSRGLNNVADVVAEITSSSKHHDKLQKAKDDRRSSKRIHFKNRRKSRLQLFLMDVKHKLKSSYAVAFYVWFLWLTVGTIFYALEENLTFCQAIYVSTSIGYGIFWYDQSSPNNYATLFSTLHFSIGVFGVAFVMAIFARSLISRNKEWFNEAKQKRSMETASASEGRWDILVSYFDYYWPKVYVHLFFLLWMLLGIVWGVTSVKWSVLDAWLFCMTAMATGGLVSLPSSGVHEWDYVFVSLYIIVGAPLMAVSCGISAHNISMYGQSSKMDGLLNAAMTEDELVMLKHLGIEDGDGSICEGEFAILILVRIGALNPDLIGVLFDRYDELARDDMGKVTYDTLRCGDSFMGSAKMLMPFSFRGSFQGSFQGSLNEKALVKKLRPDSMGG